jgi:TPR repeat protein
MQPHPRRPGSLPRSIVTLLLSAACAAALAQPIAPQTTPPVGEAAVAIETDAEAFKQFYSLLALSANHPNERYRLYGQKAAASGDWAEAVESFRMAARYADKYSQHRLSLLYWHGVGVREDRVQAYLWADIAAERGYPQFLAIRERMWQALSPQQQAAVAERGPALYAEYGDPKAKRRFEIALGRGRTEVTGSRTGYVGPLGVSTGDSLRGMLPDPEIQVALGRLHSPSRNDPERYWAQEDRLWKSATVRIGDIEAVPRATPAEDAPRP